MAFRKNQTIPNAHFHKHWQRRIRTWFNQPARKLKRANTRKANAVAFTPRPRGFLRPIVHCPTQRYNMRLRAGRGFSLQELKRAGIIPAYAKTIGVAVDFRRQNRSYESLTANVQRLEEYKKKLILFPKKNSAIDVSTAVSGKHMPIVKPKEKLRSTNLTEDMKKYSGFHAIRQGRAELRSVGKRLKAAQEEE